MRISVPRIIFLSFLTAACFSTAALASNATPCANLVVTASPTTASVGQPITLAGEVTNCSTATEKLSVIYNVIDPNGVADTYSYAFGLAAGKTRSDSTIVAAPSTPGTYTIDVSVYSGGQRIAENTQTVTVQ